MERQKNRMRCEEAQELISTMVDDELPDQERPSIDVHLRDCRRCRFTYEQELVLKREIHLAATGLIAPPDLRERILSDLGIVQEKANPTERWKGSYRLAKMAPRPAFALAVLLLLALPILYFVRPIGQPISAAALETHEKIMTGTISFVRASQGEIKRQLLGSVEGKFAPMEYELSMVGLQAVGWLVQEAGGRTTFVTIYEGKGPLLMLYFPRHREGCSSRCGYLF